MKPVDLIKRGDYLFGKKQAVDSLWQELALNFYPARASFTTSINLGESFADHLTSSFPTMVHRDLSNQFGSMLRRGDWFSLTVDGDEPRDTDAKSWLQHAEKIQRKAMYARPAQFERATKEGDKDFTAFGQCAISAEFSPTAGLLYRCHHLGDMAWVEDENGEIKEKHRKWKPTVSTLMKMFKNVDPKVARRKEKDPFSEIECRHIIMPAEDYEGQLALGDFPYVSIYLDVENKHLLEETPLPHGFYVIPRWETQSGSPYAHSPAAIVALPDARMVQDMSRVLLTAGEKAVDPPMIAQTEVVTGDVNLYAGGLTYLDQNYDERFGVGLRPLQTDTKGLPAGMEMLGAAQAMLSEMFYLNKLSLPITGEMTAYETEQRIKEYIRQALPIFEPVEKDYNAQLCEQTFTILMAAGRFGAPPTSLDGRDTEWQFTSPIRDAEEREKAGKFTEAMGLIAQAGQLDPTAVATLDMDQSLRDALDGIDAPEEWIRDPEKSAEIREQLLAGAQQQ